MNASTWTHQHEYVLRIWYQLTLRIPYIVSWCPILHEKTVWQVVKVGAWLSTRYPRINQQLTIRWSKLIQITLQDNQQNPHPSRSVWVDDSIFPAFFFSVNGGIRWLDVSLKGTLPETNIVCANRPLEKEIPYWKPPFFQGLCQFQRVYFLQESLCFFLFRSIRPCSRRVQPWSLLPASKAIKCWYLWQRSIFFLGDNLDAQRWVSTFHFLNWKLISGT